MVNLKKPFNPFEGRNKEEVWQEIRKRGMSLRSQPEMIKQLRAIAAEQKRNNKPS